MKRIGSRSMILTGYLAFFLGLLGGCAELAEVQKEKVEQPKSRVYVANESSNSVTVIDAVTFKVIGTVDEICTYVSKRVPEATGQNQNPVKKGEVEGQLILGRVR